jgi:hypothetical protein
MPSVRSAFTPSSNSIPRMSGTRVPAGIADAGGEANDSPGSGPLSDSDMDAWMSMRLPVSTGLWRAGEVDVSDEQATIQRPTPTTTAATCKRRHDSDMSEERCISSKPSSSDDIEIERFDHQAVKPDLPQIRRPNHLGPYRAVARPRVHTLGRSALRATVIGGVRECQAAWLFGVSVREYQELEAGTNSPTVDTWDRICKLYGGQRRSWVPPQGRGWQDARAGGRARPRAGRHPQRAVQKEADK